MSTIALRATPPRSVSRSWLAYGSLDVLRHAVAGFDLYRTQNIRQAHPELAEHYDPRFPSIAALAPLAWHLQQVAHSHYRTADEFYEIARLCANRVPGLTLKHGRGPAIADLCADLKSGWRAARRHRVELTVYVQCPADIERTLFLRESHLRLDVARVFSGAVDAALDSMSGKAGRVALGRAYLRDLVRFHCWSEETEAALLVAAQSELTSLARGLGQTLAEYLSEPADIQSFAAQAAV